MFLKQFCFVFYNLKYLEFWINLILNIHIGCNNNKKKQQLLNPKVLNYF